MKRSENGGVESFAMRNFIVRNVQLTHLKNRTLPQGSDLDINQLYLNYVHHFDYLKSYLWGSLISTETSSAGTSTL